MAFTDVLHEGKRYMEVWPSGQELAKRFPEDGVIRLTRMAFVVAPPVVALAVMWQFTMGSFSLLPTLLVASAILLLLPYQLLFWLGNRSEARLPPALAHWYKDLHQKLESSGAEMHPAKTNPKYFDMAKLLVVAGEYMHQ